MFSNRLVLVGTITIPGAPNLAPVEGAAPVMCPFGCKNGDINGGKHAFTSSHVRHYADMYSVMHWLRMP